MKAFIQKIWLLGLVLLIFSINLGTASYPIQAQEDPDVYENNDQAMDLFNNAKALQFSASNPHDFHGHIVYDLKGQDLQGGWECKRRYNEFHVLHEALSRRWPGIVIPLCPPKKAMGNKGAAFV